MASIPIYSGIDEKPSEDAVLSRRGCCFWTPCMQCDRLTFSFGSNWWPGITDDAKADGNRCWYKGLSPFKKIKEWSELIVGPKLKALIRRFNKQRCRQGKFQYDLTSYLLNFDEGQRHSEGNNHRLLRNFSTTYTSILIPAKSTINLGEDRPTFTWLWIELGFRRRWIDAAPRVITYEHPVNVTSAGDAFFWLPMVSWSSIYYFSQTFSF